MGLTLSFLLWQSSKKRLASSSWRTGLTLDVVSAFLKKFKMLPLLFPFNLFIGVLRFPPAFLKVVCDLPRIGTRCLGDADMFCVAEVGGVADGGVGGRPVDGSGADFRTAVDSSRGFRNIPTS